MKRVTLRAHFDGRHIQLDEPFELQPNTDLIVTVLPSQRATNADEDWFMLAKRGLVAAYSEEEVDYPATLIKEPK